MIIGAIIGLVCPRAWHVAAVCAALIAASAVTRWISPEVSFTYALEQPTFALHATWIVIWAYAAFGLKKLVLRLKNA